MARLLLESEIIAAFRDKPEFKTSEVRKFYQKHQKDIKNSTVNWRIYHLVKFGVIVRKKIGLYQINNNRTI